MGVKEMDIPKDVQKLILDFYFLKIEQEMIFDAEIVDTKYFEIINEHKIKSIKNHEGMSCKLKYGIAVKDKSIKSISWKVKICKASSFPNAIHFIGVVSNRTVQFDKSPFSRERKLKDSYGISGNSHSIYRPHFRGIDNINNNYPGYQLNKWITVKYVVAESKLVYSGLRGNGVFELPLPTNIKDITHWYPAFTLRDEGDIYEISDIVVELV